MSSQPFRDVLLSFLGRHCQSNGVSLSYTLFDRVQGKDFVGGCETSLQELKVIDVREEAQRICLGRPSHVQRDAVVSVAQAEKLGLSLFKETSVWSGLEGFFSGEPIFNILKQPISQALSPTANVTLFCVQRRRPNCWTPQFVA